MCQMVYFSAVANGEIQSGKDEFSTPHFRSSCRRLANLNELSAHYQKCTEKVKEIYQRGEADGACRR